MSMKFTGFASAADLIFMFSILIFNDFHRFSLIVFDFNWFLLICIDLLWFSLIFIDFHRCSLILGPGCRTSCGGLWRVVAGCGSLWRRSPTPYIFLSSRIEAWKLQSSRPGLLRWQLDPAGLDWLVDWLTGVESGLQDLTSIPHARRSGRSVDFC